MKLPKKNSSKGKKLAQFSKKLKKFDAYVERLEAKMKELEINHHGLVEKMLEADSKVARLNQKVKGLRVKIKGRDRRVQELEIKFQDQWNRLKENSLSTSAPLMNQDPKPSPSLQNIKELKSEDSEAVDRGGKGVVAVGKGSNHFFEEAKEKDTSKGNFVVAGAGHIESSGSGEDRCQFECPLCAEDFKTLQEVGNHLKSHDIPKTQSELFSTSCQPPTATKKPKFRCTVCDRHLSSLSALKRHQTNIHNNVRMKETEMLGALSRRQSHIHSSRDYQCKYCADTFPTWAKFRSENHMEKHEEFFQGTRKLPPVFRGSPSIIKHKCVECSKYCDTKEILKAHFMKSHAWRKHYVCQVERCERSFTTIDVLKKHAKWHEKERLMIESDAE